MTAVKTNGGQPIYEVDSDSEYSQIPNDTYFKHNFLGITLYKTAGGTVINPYISAPGGATFELVGVVSKTNVNANAGQASFLMPTEHSYDGNVLMAVLTKCTEAFDVDSVACGIQDKTSESQACQAIVTPVNGIVLTGSDANTSWSQPNGSGYQILVVNVGKGSLIGGNTTGEISVYALFNAIP